MPPSLLATSSIAQISRNQYIMEVSDIIEQIEHWKKDSHYCFHCCNCEFTNLYEFRKHLFENHTSIYTEAKPFFHMELPPKPSKAELRGRKAKCSKKLSHKKKRYYPLKDHNVHTPAAWIIYHHNGPKK